MHQTKKGNEWHHGMKMHISVDDGLGLIHTITTTGANAHDITQADQLLHGEYLRFGKNINRLCVLAGFTNLLRMKSCLPA